MTVAVGVDAEGCLGVSVGERREASLQQTCPVIKLTLHSLDVSIGEEEEGGDTEVNRFKLWCIR